MHLVLSCTHIGLNHLIHYRVKVANPRKLNGLVWVALATDIVLEDIVHHKALDTLTLILRSNTEDYSKDAVSRLCTSVLFRVKFVFKKREKDFMLATRVYTLWKNSLSCNLIILSTFLYV